VPAFIIQNTKKPSDKWSNIALFGKPKPTSVHMYLCMFFSAFFIPTSLFMSDSYRNQAKATQLLLYYVKRMSIFFKSILSK